MVLPLFIAIAARAQQSTPITLKELLTRVDQKAPTLITDSAAILDPPCPGGGDPQ